MIRVWLWNCMTPNIMDALLFLKKAKDIWDTLKQEYSKVNDAARVEDSQ
ncbi:hypothetical protein LINPERPRIM_LOCUS37211 [Linum perenne]